MRLEKGSIHISKEGIFFQKLKQIAELWQNWLMLNFIPALEHEGWMEKQQQLYSMMQQQKTVQLY